MISSFKNITALLALVLCLSSFVITGQTGSVTVNQNREIDALLELKKDINRTTSNFKIQIYNGNRIGAENARSEFNRSYYSWPVSTVFETPNYKIWIGNFKTRLEADRALVEIKQKFPNAFIFKPAKKKKEP